MEFPQKQIQEKAESCLFSELNEVIQLETLRETRQFDDMKLDRGIGLRSRSNSKSVSTDDNSSSHLGLIYMFQGPLMPTLA